MQCESELGMGEGESVGCSSEGVMVLIADFKECAFSVCMRSSLNVQLHSIAVVLLAPLVQAAFVTRSALM